MRHKTDVVFASLSLWPSQINAAATLAELRYSMDQSWVSKVGGEIVTESDLKVIFFTFAINNHQCRLE